ncbi:MAG: hypothetical protein MJ252_17160 [archaeon]|nr:hypothetical protein [archaeon]
METNKKINTFFGHYGRVGVVAWNNNLLASGSKDSSIVLRDIRCANIKNITTGENQQLDFIEDNSIIYRYYGHKQEVCGLKWSFDGTQLASGGNDNKLILWNLYSNSPVMIGRTHCAAVKAIAWSPHERNLLVSGGGTADRTICLWNTSNLTQINKIQTGSQVCNLIFSKTVNELVSTHGYALNQIMLWKVKDMTKIATLSGHASRVLYLGISPNGQNIVTGAGDETLNFWKLFPPTKTDSESNLFPSIQDIR